MSSIKNNYNNSMTKIKIKWQEYSFIRLLISVLFVMFAEIRCYRIGT